MAVGAANLTFRYLRLDTPPVYSSPAELRNAVKLFPRNVIKFQHAQVRFPAVVAAFIRQKLSQTLRIASAVILLVTISPSIMQTLVAEIVGPRVYALTRAAVRALTLP